MRRHSFGLRPGGFIGRGPFRGVWSRYSCQISYSQQSRPTKSAQSSIATTVSIPPRHVLMVPGFAMDTGRLLWIFIFHKSERPISKSSSRGCTESKMQPSISVDTSKKRPDGRAPVCLNASGPNDDSGGRGICGDIDRSSCLFVQLPVAERIDSIRIW